MSWDWAANEVASLCHSAEDKVSSYGHEVAHFVELTGQSALHAAIQDPIDGLTQLVNHAVKPLTGYELPKLDLVEAPPPAKFGSEDWYAETLGSGLGRAADFLLLSGAVSAIGETAAVGSAADFVADLPGISGIVEQAAVQAAEHPILAKLAVSAGRAALVGGVYGAALIPAKTEQGEMEFWKERAANGIIGAIAGAVAGTVAQGTNLAFKGLGMPIEDEAFKSSAKGIGSRALAAIIRGSSNGVARTEAAAVLGQGAASSQVFAQRITTSIVNSLLRTAISDGSPVETSIESQ